MTKQVKITTVQVTTTTVQDIPRRNSQSVIKYPQYKFTLMVSGVPRNFFGVGGSTNSVEDRGQIERGSGGGSPLEKGSAQFANGETRILIGL
jgi:hypothetical protein